MRSLHLCFDPKSSVHIIFFGYSPVILQVFNFRIAIVKGLSIISFNDRIINSCWCFNPFDPRQHIFVKDFSCWFVWHKGIVNQIWTILNKDIYTSSPNILSECLFNSCKALKTIYLKLFEAFCFFTNSLDIPLREQNNLIAHFLINSFFSYMPDNSSSSFYSYFSRVSELTIFFCAVSMSLSAYCFNSS